MKRKVTAMVLAGILAMQGVVPAAAEEIVPLADQTQVTAEATAQAEAPAQPEVTVQPEVQAEAPVQAEVPAQPEVPVQEEVAAQPETLAQEEVAAQPETLAQEEVTAQPETPVQEEVTAQPEVPTQEEVPAQAETADPAQSETQPITADTEEAQAPEAGESAEVPADAAGNVDTDEEEIVLDNAPALADMQVGTEANGASAEQISVTEEQMLKPVRIEIEKPSTAYNAMTVLDDLSKLKVSVYYEGQTEPEVLSNWIRVRNDEMAFTCAPSNRDYVGAMEVVDENGYTLYAEEGYFLPFGTFTVRVTMQNNMDGEQTVGTQAITIEKPAADELPAEYSIAAGQTKYYHISPSTENRILNIQMTSVEDGDDWGACLYAEIYVVNVNGLSCCARGEVDGTYGWEYDDMAKGSEYVLTLKSESTGAYTGTFTLADRKILTEAKIQNVTGSCSQLQMLGMLRQKVGVNLSYEDGSTDYVSNWVYTSRTDETGEWHYVFQCGSSNHESLRLCLQKDGAYIDMPDDTGWYIDKSIPPVGEYTLVLFVDDVQQDAFSFTVTPEEVQKELVLGMEYQVEVAKGESVWYRFTPAADGDYFLYAWDSVGEDQNSCVEVYDSEYHCIAEDDESGYGNHFSLKQTLNAGQTYYFNLKGSAYDACTFAFCIKTLANPTSIRFDEERTRTNYSVGYYIEVYGKDITVCIAYDDGSEQKVYANYKPDAYGNYVRVNLYEPDASGAADLTKPVDMFALPQGEYILVASLGTKIDYEFTENQNVATASLRIFVGDEHKHEWNPGDILKPPTCAEEGEQEYVCSCGQKEVRALPIVPDAHSWDEGAVTTEATCGAAGVRTFTCTACKATRTEEIAATGVHTWDGGVVTQAASCKAAGVRTFTCTVCKNATRTEEIAATGVHAWNKGVVTQAASCKAAGVKTFTCEECGETRTETIEMTAHTYGAYKTTTEPTVLKEGVQTSTCSVCGAKQTKSVAKLKAAVKFTVKKVPLQVKKTFAAKSYVTGLQKGDSIKTWTSNKPKVATVDKKTGKVTAKKKGTAVITATTVGGAKSSFTVTVQSPVVRTTAISGLKKSASVQIGKTITLKPTITPVTSQDKVTYTSSNKKVATVSAKGVVKGVKAGTAKITVTSGKKKFVVTVKVTRPAVTAIKNVPKSVSVKKGKTYTLKPKFSPAGSTGTLKYTSSNKKVATVNAKGKITAKKKGTATITVQTGKIKVTCKVTVK